MEFKVFVLFHLNNNRIESNKIIEIYNKSETINNTIKSNTNNDSDIINSNSNHSLMRLIKLHLWIIFYF